MKQVLVGLPDSGVDPSLADRIVCERRFTLDADGNVQALPARGDVAGHGSALSCIIATLAPRAGLANAQVFGAKGPGAPVVVAAGVAWLAAQGADIISMSFGLRADRKVLRDACSAALAAGVILVAATPARGDAVYPAAYPGVLRATGDARCAPGEYAYVADDRADFGACPGPLDHVPHQPGAGASLAAAHVSGALASYLCGGGRREEAVCYLRSRCGYQGRERRE